MPEPPRTAVILPVGAADAVLAEHRRHLDVAASWGVPAHVTVIHPFVPLAAVDGSVIDRLAAVFAAASPFECTFSTCRWFGDDVLWLAPDDDQTFRALTIRVAQEFPDHQPYGGQFSEVIPHLTVGDTRRATVRQLHAAEADIAGELPITASIRSALLMAGTERPDSWRTLATLPLGGAPG